MSAFPSHGILFFLAITAVCRGLSPQHPASLTVAPQAVLRVRCSSGLSVGEYQGNINIRTPTDADLPAVDADKAIMVRLRHDDKLTEGTEAAFQCAILYTTTSGEGRLQPIGIDA